ncbi:MAG: LytTR family transcriptional regulator DNA-binding domain-containing protein [Anaerolineae bacterium]|nr:LytTR family transcriptional regulator DNA-binding domain-containing protein [Anaerolineae bacterium]
MIELIHLQKTIAQATVVDIELLRVEKGQIAAIVGATSQVKTVLGQMLGGRVPPTAGTVRLAGLDPATQWAQLSRRVGLLAPENSLYPRLTARQNLTFYADLYGVSRGRADELLHQVGLMDRANERVEHLSPSMARRLALGRTLLHQPEILLLLEPYAECDAASVAILSRLIQEQSAAILIVASDKSGLHTLKPTCYWLEQGKLRLEETVAAAAAESHLPFKIPARLDGKVALVNPGDILYAATDESKTTLYTKTGPIPTHLNMSEVEQRLARQGFFRAHRTHLVNLQHIKEIVTYTRNSYTIILDDAAATEIPLSKTAARDLRELLDY